MVTRGSLVAGQAPAVQDHAALQRSVTRLVGGRFGQHADLRLHSTVARLLLPLRLARCLAPHSLQLHLRVANSLRRLHTHLRLVSSVARLNLQQWHGRFLPRTLRTDLRLELSRLVVGLAFAPRPSFGEQHSQHRQTFDCGCRSGASAFSAVAPQTMPLCSVSTWIFKG